MEDTNESDLYHNSHQPHSINNVGRVEPSSHTVNKEEKINVLNQNSKAGTGDMINEPTHREMAENNVKGNLMMCQTDKYPIAIICWLNVLSQFFLK